MTILNLCRRCDTDFASVAAFDRHRVGTHEYTLAEGLRVDHPVDDGRRCLDQAEMTEHGMEVDDRGRWRIAMTEVDQKRLYALQGSAESATER